MSLEASVLALYEKYSNPVELTRRQRNERRFFISAFEEMEIEGVGPIIWVGTYNSTLLFFLTVTTLPLLQLLLLTQLPQSITTHTITTDHHLHNHYRV
jgi:hypothetical protein